MIKYVYSLQSFLNYTILLLTAFYSLHSLFLTTFYSLPKKSISTLLHSLQIFFLWYVIHKIPFHTVPHSLQDFIHYNVSLSALLHAYRISSSAPFMLIHWFHDVVTPTMAARQTTLSGLMIYGHIYCVQRT